MKHIKTLRKTAVNPLSQIIYTLVILKLIGCENLKPLIMNKSKLYFAIGTSILFVMLGIYLYQTQSETIDSSYSLMKIIGIACIVFFGIVGLIGLKKLLSIK